MSRTPSSCGRNLTLQAGIRQEFTTGWNEVSGRAANYITDAQRRAARPTPLVGNSVFTQNNATQLFGPRVGLAWDVVRQRQDRGPRRLRNLLFADRRSQLPAELAAAVQRLGLVCERLVCLRSCRSCPGVPPRAVLRPGRSAPCTTFAPQGVQPNAKLPRSRSGISRGAAARPQHGAARGLCRVVRIPRPAQRRSQQHSGADLRQRRAAAQSGGTRHHREAPCRRARSTSPSGTRPNPYLGAGFFWYTEGNSSYNALQIDVTPPPEPRPAIPRQLHLVEESGHEFGAHRRAGQQPGADDPGPQRSAPRLGPSALNVASQASISGQLRTAVRPGSWQRRRRQADRRLAVERHRDAAERLPVHAAGRLEPLRRRRHAQSRPAVAESRVSPGRSSLGSPEPVVQPERVRSAGRRHLRESGPRRLHRPGPGRSGSVAVQEHRLSASAPACSSAAEFFNALNHANFGTPNAIVFSGTSIQRVGGTDHHHRHHVAADSVRPEADLLMGSRELPRDAITVAPARTCLPARAEPGIAGWNSNLFWRAEP